MMNRTIWTFWEGQSSVALRDCQASWKIHLVGWQVHFLTTENLSEFGFRPPRGFRSMSRSMQSDIVRLQMLYYHGGVWMDATILLKRSLDWIDMVGKGDFVGFKLRTHKHIENWFLAARAKSPLIRRWYKVLIDVIRHPDSYPHLSCCKFKNDVYFSMYRAYVHLIRTDPSFAQQASRASLGNALRYMNLSFFFSPPLLKMTREFRAVYNHPSFQCVHKHRRIIMLAVAAFVLLLLLRIVLVKKKTDRREEFRDLVEF